MSLIQELDHLKIPLQDIKFATDDFAHHNFIGHGGFGRVYKGHLAAGNQHTAVAVKRLDVKGGQGQREFIMEIIMSSYKHENLVTVVGFSDESDEKIVIYKHEVRGSLDKYLASTDLTWIQRLQICLGAARGLNYLHTGVSKGHRVLHRDIKSSNVLLDENWTAKISDFGLSKIGPTNQEFSFLVTNAAGTPGYVDPVYIRTGVLTKESDVFSFGVVLFEVLCGRPAMIVTKDDDHRFLSELVKLRYKEGKLDEIIMRGLRKQVMPNSLQTFVTIAFQCLEEDRKQRPTMGLVVEELQNSLVSQTEISTMAATTPTAIDLQINQFCNCDGCIRRLKITLKEVGGVELIPMDLNPGKLRISTAKHPQVIQFALQKEFKKAVDILPQQKEFKKAVGTVLPASNFNQNQPSSSRLPAATYHNDVRGSNGVRINDVDSEYVMTPPPPATTEPSAPLIPTTEGQATWYPADQFYGTFSESSRNDDPRHWCTIL